MRRPWLLLLAPLLARCDCGGSGLNRLRPDIEASPNPLVFDTPPLGATARGVVTVSNRGQATLAVTELVLIDEATAGFSLADPTPFTLAPNQAQTVDVHFSPVRLGDARGTLAIHSDDPDTPVAEVALTAAHRTGPVLASCVESTDLGLAFTCGSTLAIAFGPRGIGSATKATVHLSSEGTEPVVIDSITFTRDPSLEAGEVETPLALAPGERRSIEVWFRPAVADPASGTLEVFSSIPAATSLVSFSGAGVETGLCFDPPTLDFGSVALGASSEKTVRIWNCGSTEAAITEIKFLDPGAEFTLVDPAALPLVFAAGPAYSLRVRYQPDALGEDHNRVSVVSGGGANMIPLIGRTGGCFPVVTPAAVVWDADIERGVAKNVLVQNDGDEPCTISEVALTSTVASIPFFVDSSPDVPHTLPPGASSNVTIYYSNGEDRDSVILGRADLEVSFVEYPTRAVPLSTEDTQHLPCDMIVTETSLQFGATLLGARRTISIGIGNIGTETCLLNTVELRSAHPDFHIASVEPPGPLDFLNPSKAIYVDYLPTQAVEATGILHLETTDPLDPTFDIPLSGSAFRGDLCVDPKQLPFGEVQTASTRTFNISACGAAPVTIDAVGFSLPDAELSLVASPATPFTLAPGDTRSVEVRYQPADGFPDSAEITVSASDPFLPDQLVRATGGASILPPSAGSFLYFWRVNLDRGGGSTDSEIWRQPLQGDPTPSILITGGGPQNRCYACHVPSPDGRYIFLEAAGDPFRIWDTVTSTTFSLAYVGDGGTFFSWKPDVNTNPPYQYVYTHLDDLYVGSLYEGGVGQPLSGASDPNVVETMASWGPNGQIAYVRSTGDKALWILEGGVTELYLIDDAGGTGVPVSGAAGHGARQYYPQISPDGEWIAFTINNTGNTTWMAADAQIRLVRTDQSGTVVDPGSLNAGATTMPTWSKDGLHLSFSSNRTAGNYDIYIAPFDPAAGTVGPVTTIPGVNTPAFEHSAQWSP